MRASKVGVYMLHASNTLSFYSNMALPQTAAGVGAIGIDPPEDALAKISTVVDIFK